MKTSHLQELCDTILKFKNRAGSKLSVITHADLLNQAQTALYFQHGTYFSEAIHNVEHPEKEWLILRGKPRAHCFLHQKVSPHLAAHGLVSSHSNLLKVFPHIRAQRNEGVLWPPLCTWTVLSVQGRKAERKEIRSTIGKDIRKCEDIIHRKEDRNGLEMECCGRRDNVFIFLFLVWKVNLFGRKKE